MRWPLLFATLALTACATMPANSTQAKQNRGAALAQTHCTRCHAIGANGASPAPEAPAFRDMEARYRVADLPSLLAGVVPGLHPPMADLRLSARDSEAIGAYLRATQSTR